MTKALIASHGRTASGIESTVRLFMSDADITSIDAYVDGSDDGYDDDIRAFLDSVCETDIAYIFTDIYGGSVNQHVAAELLKRNCQSVTLITNANVPIIIDLLMRPEKPGAEEIKNIVDEFAKPRVVILDELTANTPGEDSFFE